jgi:hypothetical protein
MTQSHADRSSLYFTETEAKQQEKLAFFHLADALARSSDDVEQQRLKEELARMTFGES